MADFLKKNPQGGLHHLCLVVAAVLASMASVAAAGTRLLSTEPKVGTHGTRRWRSCTRWTLTARC